MGLAVSLDNLKLKTRRWPLAGVFCKGQRMELTLLLAWSDTWSNFVAEVDARMAGKKPTERELFDAYLPGFANHVVHGWENAFDENGNVEPYTPAELIALMQRMADNDLMLAKPPVASVMIKNYFRDFAPPDAEALGKS